MTKARYSPWRERYKVHPIADLFPMMSDEELAKLGEDIRKNGQRVPILLWGKGNGDAVLIDGRNRLEAMERAGLGDPSKALTSTIGCKDPAHHRPWQLAREHTARPIAVVGRFEEHDAMTKEKTIKNAVLDVIDASGREQGLTEDPERAPAQRTAKQIEADVTELKRWGGKGDLTKAMIGLAREGAIINTGRRQDGQICWVATPQFDAAQCRQTDLTTIDQLLSAIESMSGPEDKLLGLKARILDIIDAEPGIRTEGLIEEVIGRDLTDEEREHVSQFEQQTEDRLSRN